MLVADKNNKPQFRKVTVKAEVQDQTHANGHRYWFDEPFSFTGIAEIDKKLSGFPVAVFLPEHRRREETPLVIALQGMSAPYGWNTFIVPTLTSMGIAVALFDTPFAGERRASARF